MAAVIYPSLFVFFEEVRQWFGTAKAAWIRIGVGSFEGSTYTYGKGLFQKMASPRINAFSLLTLVFVVCMRFWMESVMESVDR